MRKINYLLYGLALLLAAGAAAAQMPDAAPPVPAAPAIPARGYILLDARSGDVLAEKQADDPMDPASITKLMTAYAVFAELAKGNLSLDDMVTVSEKAWRTPGSRTFIEVGTRVRLEDLVRGMIIQSGNDASVALAEHVAGTEAAFAELMNQYAASLGMNNTHFVNATGLPAEEHYSSARDIARLATAIVTRFPAYYRYYSEREFTYNDITQRNRNALLWRDASVDGMKTGMTDAAGYCLVASALRDDMRLISVVLGTTGPKVRADASQALLNWGFRFFETHRLYAAGEPVTQVRVWKGDREQAGVGLDQDLWITLPRGRYEAVEAVAELESPLVAPLPAEEPVGKLRVTLDGNQLALRTLRPLATVPEGGLLRQAMDTVLLWME
ncbi:MAG: D-alanyl-D-alanine carboxypeptidase [Gammaproteobacteria bacterium]